MRFRTAVLAAAVALAPACGTEGAIEDPAPSPSAREVALEEARWAGTWRFDYSLVRLEGVAEDETNFTLGSRIARVWEVNPGCPEGPCNAEIMASDPSKPDLPATRSVITYQNGIYRITERFPPEPGQGCLTASGRVIPAAFEATNEVEVKPTKFQESEDGAVVTELLSTKTTTFRPTGPAAGAGGTCVVKTAVWEGPVNPA